jgi:membrane fusion protein (multidrug efflux system)
MDARMPSTLVKQAYFLRLITSSLLLTILINPMSIAFASDANRPASAAEAVTASAVIVPAHVSELGFLISGIAREVPVKEGDSVKAGQSLLILDTPDLEFAVTEAQAALRSAQSYADLQKYGRIKNRRNGKIFYDEIPIEYRQRADARVQQAQVALELAQINLAENTLIAPFDGTVASLQVIPGEYVQSDQAVITLATLNDLNIETTDLSERDIANVKIGTPVDISVEALNDNFTGKVISISPIANTVGGDVVFKVTIAFDKQPEHLLWGMTAEVTIGS